MFTKDNTPNVDQTTLDQMNAEVKYEMEKMVFNEFANTVDDPKVLKFVEEKVRKKYIAQGTQ